MKATELRIGNYVQNTKGDVLKISRLNNEDADKEIRGWQIKNPAFGSSNEFIKPIPLTEEWLLRFGFDKQDNNWKRYSICNDWTYIYWEKLAGVELSVSKHSCMLPHIQYVHQLQNLYYALTNKELTINL